MKHTNVNNYVQYPFEYFLAAILFVFKIHEVDPQKRSKIKLVHWYTQLYSIITDYNMANETDRAWVWDVLNTFENSINNNDDPHVAAQEVFDMYMAQTFSKKTLAHINYRKKSNVQDNVGCFALSYDTYYKKGNVLRLQFVPIREGLNHEKGTPEHASDLSAVYTDKRREEFKQLLINIHKNPAHFKGAEYFMSSTWLQHVPFYKGLFPNSSSVVREDDPQSIPWIWTQFIKWNFEGNKNRLAQFEAALNEANDFYAVINSIPLNAQKVTAPLQDMFKMYEIA